VRAHSAFRMTNAPTAALPGASLYGTGSARLLLLEVHVFNTTTTACVVALRRLTTAGTQGSAQSKLPEDPNAAAPTGDPRDSHTAGPTITAGEFVRADLAAAIGGGIVWTFEKGIYIPNSTAQGVGILTPTGTGQVCDVTFVWDE